MAASPAFATMPYPAWDLVALDGYALPLVNKRYVIVETSRGCPVHVRFLRRADPPGPQVPRAQREVARRRDRAQLSRARGRVLLPVGRHRHAEREVVQRLLRRIDRAQPADPVVRQRPRRQSHRSGVRAAAQARRLLDARARHRVGVRRGPQGHGQAARAGKDPGSVPQHAPGGHPLVRLFHLRLPGRDARDDGPHHRLRHPPRPRLRQLLSRRPVSRDRALRQVHPRLAAARGSAR